MENSKTNLVNGEPEEKSFFVEVRYLLLHIDNSHWYLLARLESVIH